MYSSSPDLDQSLNTLEDIYDGMSLLYGVTKLGISGVMLAIAVIGVLFSLAISLLLFILEAIPLSVISKKLGKNAAWMAWMPLFSSYFRQYVVTDMAGDKEVVFLEGEKYSKYTIKSRPLSFWIWAGIRLFGSTLITTVLGIGSFIPVLNTILGILAPLLYLVPTVATGWMEYVYTKDVLDLFKEDKKSNRTAAIVVSALDSFVTLGFARTVLMYTIMKKNPLPQKFGVNH